MAISYPWECKFCGAGNLAGTDHCAICRKEAIARPIDVDPRLEKQREEFEQRQRRFEAIPQPLRAITTILWSVALFGGVVAKFAWTIGATVVGVVIVAVAGIPAFIITKLYAGSEPEKK